MLEIRQIAYNKSGITHVLKLPFSLTYPELDENVPLTKEQAGSILVDAIDYIRVNCEIRRKAIRKKKVPTNKKGKK